MAPWDLTDADREMLDREVAPFLPDRIFDAHAHLFCAEHYAPGTRPAHQEGNPELLGLEEYFCYSEWLHPGGRVAGGLFFGLAFTGDRDANNAFVAAEVARVRAQGRPVFGQLVAHPGADPNWLREQVQRGGFVGLKCYHTMAHVDGPTWNAPIEAYLPEEHVRLAHEQGLSITLHMVRDRALADPLNQATIRRYCERYPNMRLILAHAARGFNPWHTIEGIESLRGLGNVWFDTSAVTEAGAFEAIVETMGHQRLLYGTDFYISHLRGRCVAVGDSFHWFYAEEMNLAERHTTLRPVLVGLESLRSLRLAARRLKLTDEQIEDIFYNNAAQLFAFR
jgi:predicted TIM-barrel fold metal-dependent hydrolase